MTKFIAGFAWKVEGSKSNPLVREKLGSQAVNTALGCAATGAISKWRKSTKLVRLVPNVNYLLSTILTETSLNLEKALITKDKLSWMRILIQFLKLKVKILTLLNLWIAKAKVLKDKPLNIFHRTTITQDNQIRETDLNTVTMLPTAFRMATKSSTSISMEEI